MAALGFTGIRLDPLKGYNFSVNLLDSSSPLGLSSLATTVVADTLLGGFSECGGLDMVLEVEDYKEGGRNGGLLKFPTRQTWQPLTLKRGMAVFNVLWDWAHGFAEGRGKRKDGVIMLLNDLHLPSHIWQFRRGLPIKYTGPSLLAGQSTVAIESIEIVHEGLTQLPYSAPAAAAVAAGAAAVLGG